jgi:hypothetical protein
MGQREKYTGARMDLAEKTIMEVILEEFEMYHAHLRLINKKPNYGWLRNMYHSLSQQVMRQDPKYFAIYCVCSAVEKRRCLRHGRRLHRESARHRGPVIVWAHVQYRYERRA